MTKRIGKIVRSVIFLSAMGLLVFATNPVEGAARSDREFLAPRGPMTSIDSIQDTALTIGTLPNGLRYYIKVAKVPAKRAQLWLAVDVGSVQEDEDQRGFAHFVEHMAFNGTTNFPHNTLIDFVEQSGLSFGADLNAHTNFDETVYKLTVPTDDPNVLHKGLQVIEDWASGGITMDSLEVVKERGVVLGEWRIRNPDTLTQRYYDMSFLQTFGDSSQYLNRFPIGLPKLLFRAQPAPLKRFYHDWYRPDLMAVIVVGDFDKRAMEREIKRRFGKIPKSVNPRQFTIVPRPRPDKLGVDIINYYVGPYISMNWVAPEIATNAKEDLRNQIVETILFQHLNTLFTKAWRLERRPFAGARIIRNPALVKSLVDEYTLEVVASADSLESGLASALTEVARVGQFGIASEALERQKAALLRRLEYLASAESAVPSSQLMDIYTRHFLSKRGHLLSSAQELRFAKEILPQITPEVMANAAKFWHTGKAPLVRGTFPMYASAKVATEESMRRVMDSMATVTLTAQPEEHKSNASSLLSKKPQKGSVTTTKRYDAAGVVEWTLSNGIRVLYKQSTINPEQFVLNASSLGGFSRLPENLFYSSARYVASLMTAEGGLGDQSREDLVRELNTKIVENFRVTINMFDEEVMIGGSPKDLENLFQMMYLQFTAPKVDTTALQVWRRTGGGSLYWSENDQYAASLANDPRFARPNPQMISLLDSTEAMAVYRDRFGNPADFTFVLIGAAPPPQVKEMVEQYLASMPTKPLDTRETAKEMGVKPFTKKAVNRLSGEGVPPEKAQMHLGFNAEMPQSPAEVMVDTRRINALSFILSGRLRNKLREEMGVTYGVSAPVTYYKIPKPQMRMMISVLTSPKDVDSAGAAIDRIVENVRTNGVTAEELSRAQMVLRRRQENAMQSNEWWITQLHRYDQLGVSFDQIVQQSNTSLTSEEIKATAQKYLSKDVFLRQTIRSSVKNIEEWSKDPEKSDSTSKYPTPRDSTAVPKPTH